MQILLERRRRVGPCDGIQQLVVRLEKVLAVVTGRRVDAIQATSKCRRDR